MVISRDLNFLAPTIVSDLVRVGRNNDGGYVISEKSVRESDCLISLGINDDWTFDEQFLAINHGIKIHAYDHTISAKIFARSLLGSLIRALRCGASFGEVLYRTKLLWSYANFFKGTARHFQERIVSEKTRASDTGIETVLDRAASNKIFLKMDIEGSEYGVIDDILRYSARIVGIVIEFHETYRLRAEFKSAVKKMHQHFVLVHIHANNWGGIGSDGLPEFLELTFIRNDLCFGREKRRSLPIAGLDQPCHSTRADHPLIFAD
jgi:hypothetical protein